MLDKKKYSYEKNLHSLVSLFIDSLINKNILYDYTYLSLGARLMTLGFNVTLIHFPYVKKTKKKEENIFHYLLEGRIEFTSANKPLEKYKNEFTTVKKILKKHHHNDLYPLQWATEEGEKIRNEINEKLLQQNLQEDYLAWKKKHSRLKKKIAKIIIDFKEQYPKNNLCFEYDDERDIFIIHNRAIKEKILRSSMKEDEKEKIAKKYNEQFSTLTRFLEK